MTRKNLHVRVARRFDSVRQRATAAQHSVSLLALPSHATSFNVAHRVISPTQNGAQKCTKVVRDAPLRGARSFPFSASFSCKPPRHETASPLLLAPATSLLLLLPRWPFYVFIQTRNERKLLAARVHVHVRAYVCDARISGDKQKLPCGLEGC